MIDHNISPLKIYLYFVKYYQVTSQIYYPYKCRMAVFMTYERDYGCYTASNKQGRNLVRSYIYNFHKCTLIS